jgi:hypothetical protein
MTSVLLEMCLIWTFMCRNVLCVVRRLDCKYSYKLTWRGSYDREYHRSGAQWLEILLPFDRRCTGLFIGLLQINWLHCRNTHRRHTAERCSKWNERKRRMSSLSMMTSEFLVDDQRVPFQWLSMISVSMIEFLVNDYRWFPCRWWSTSSLSMIINEFLVDDDQWLPCRW